MESPQSQGLVCSKCSINVGCYYHSIGCIILLLHGSLDSVLCLHVHHLGASHHRSPQAHPSSGSQLLSCLQPPAPSVHSLLGNLRERSLQLTNLSVYALACLKPFGASLDRLWPSALPASAVSSGLAPPMVH